METITGRDVDVIALRGFSKVMDDFHFDSNENDPKIGVTYGERGKKWIKSVKKIDPFWDENLFISNLFIQSMEKAIEDNKEIIEVKNEIIDAEVIEKKDE